MTKTQEGSVTDTIGVSYLTQHRSYFFPVYQLVGSQDCIFYEDESEYYCSDVCDPERCPEDEVCVLQHVQCLRAPCPPIAACLEDPCNGTCCETQVCPSGIIDHIGIFC